MSATKEWSVSSVILAWGIAGFFSAASAFGAAVVQEAKGDVRAGATPAQSKPITPHQRVLPGTVVTTGPGSQAILLFDDGQAVALHENTQFRIEDFSFRPQEPEADRAVFVLLQGALRALTGILGKRSPGVFSLRVPQATIGIRGTDFMVAIVNPAYLSVLEGTVTATNAAGTVPFGAGTLGSIATSATLAVSIPASALPAAVSSAFDGLGKLPIAGGKLPGTAREASAFGRETADSARGIKENLGREFGKDTSGTARERAQDRIPGGGSRRP